MLSYFFTPGPGSSLPTALVLVLVLLIEPLAGVEKLNRLYIGSTDSRVAVTGYKDAYFNDSHFSFPKDSYALVNFSAANSQGRAYGIFAGYQFYLTEEHGPNVQVSYVQRGDVSSSTIFFGYVVPAGQWKDLHISIIPQVGYASVTIDFGRLQTQDGNHIQLGADKFGADNFDSGDDITSVSRGIAFGALAEMRYKLLKASPDFELFLQLGYQIVLLNSPVIYVDGIEVTDTKAFDEPGATGSRPYDVNSNYNPFNSAESSLDGIVASAGFSYRF